MMKLHKEGVYLVEGAQLVPASQAQGHPRLQNVTPKAAKKATIAYGILQAHNQSGDPDALQIRFDALASHDITYVGSQGVKADLQGIGVAALVVGL